MREGRKGMGEWKGEGRGWEKEEGKGLSPPLEKNFWRRH